MNKYTQMASTRVRVSSKTVAGRKAVRYSIKATYTDTRFMNHWDTWYDAFAAEVNDEFPTASSSQRRQAAESRWTTFAAKSLRCSEHEVTAWLATPSGRST